MITLRELEKNFILNRLVVMGNNKTKTAKSLGIGIRTLQRKLIKYREEAVNESYTITKEG